VNCPTCEGDARFVGYRRTGVKCLMGDLVAERAYYHCPACHHGWFPSDEVFGITQKQTGAAREVICLSGVLEPFEQAGGRVLPRLTGLNVSASTVQRTSEMVGADVARRRAAGEVFGSQAGWNWNTDNTGRRVAYVSLDATAVLQQGIHAEKAEARMPWVGTVFNPPSPSVRQACRVWDRRYVAGLMSLEEIGEQLRQECRAVGLARADLVVAVTDGGNGLEDCLIDVLGGLARRIELILDFYHAAEHVREFAKLLLPREEERQSQVERWCHTLKHQGGPALLAALESLDLTSAPPAVREGHRLLTGYLRGNLHRTDYPRYLAAGWHIGSGMIEAACKTVVGQRLKESGMRWRPLGTTEMCQLRALYQSQPELWDHYWRHACA
jgi:hypothetical protein